MSQEIPKTYNPTEIEAKWYKFWEENKLFSPEENSKKESFTIVIPPPNVTGNLHMGHALDNSIQDVLIRYKKMQGFNTLWVPGTDHAGIATQNVVAKALKKEGKTKEDLGREEFIKRVWQWKEEYGGNITRQLRRLGCALDWTRERFTMDEGLSKAVTREFVTLYKQGLIYRGKRLVNWCPKCGTAISDIEVEHETKSGKLWWIKYPIEGTKDFVKVATTRPETMLGDTAVAVNPKDKRYKKLIGKMLILPLVGRKIPIVADDFVDPEFGSGAVKVTPAHDPNDFEIGERHDLPRVNILTKTAKITLEEFAESEKEFLKALAGLDRFKAREEVVRLLEEKSCLDKIEDYENSVGECYRCKSIIEPYLSDQWYVKVADLARKAIKVVEEGKIKFVPARWTKIYINWMANLRDWCISRQLWWGHRIPVWYKGDEIYVGEEAPKGDGWQQDPDVFDTWFSSALWPFSTLGWPDSAEASSGKPEQGSDLDIFYPTDVLVTGYDIITFWVSRMIMTGTHFMKKEPFHTVFIHGLVRDAQGKKMSKSFGNVIDPIKIIDDVGSDALRFALISLITGQGQDIKLMKEKITEARNFSNKIWNATRFILLNLDIDNSEIKQIWNDNTEHKELVDYWILSILDKTASDVTKCIEEYSFGEAARILYDFIWAKFCDWYVEIAKIRLYGKDQNKRKLVQAVLLYVLEKTMKLLHPFEPFITEEIYHKLLGEDITSENSIMCAKWPTREKSLLESDERGIDRDNKTQKSQQNINLHVEKIIAVIRAIRNIRAEINIPHSKELEVVLVGDLNLKVGVSYVKALARISKVDVFDKIKQKPKQAATAIVEGTQIFVPLKGIIDINKEVERLKKEQGKCEQEIAHLEKLLANKNFTAKAPKDAVQKKKDRISELKDKQKLVKERIKDLT